MTRQRGFTLPELVTVMIVLGILAAVAMPRLMDNRAFVGAAFNDDVVSALRYAQKSAVSHRRLVCASFTATAITLAIADANPATACNKSLATPDGQSYQSRDASIQVSGYPGAGIMYFQPSGTISIDGAGTLLFSGNIAITGRTLPIKVQGATGYVE